MTDCFRLFMIGLWEKFVPARNFVGNCMDCGMGEGNAGLRKLSCSWRRKQMSFLAQ